MSTTPPSPRDDSGAEPPTADLSELAATDALLDRLGARVPTDDDLLDPTAAALNSLLSDIDCEVTDPATARLLEVLAGRPLFIDNPPAAAAGDRVVDLTAVAAASGVERQPGPPVPPGADTSSGPDERGAVAVVPITAARPARWRSLAGVAAARVSTPAAAAVIVGMILLGGGVSAAVTGDPMAPLNGVGSVVAKLPGVDESTGKLDEARSELALAAQLSSSDPEQARLHLDNAMQLLADLPADETGQLSSQAAVLAGQLTPATTVPSTTSVTTLASTTTPATTGSTDPQVNPSGTGTVSATASPSVTETQSPTASPTPTSATPSLTATGPTATPTGTPSSTDADSETGDSTAPSSAGGATSSALSSASSATSAADATADSSSGT